MSAECTGCGRKIHDKERPDCRLLDKGALCPDCVAELDPDKDSAEDDPKPPVGALIAWSLGCLVTAGVAGFVAPAFIRMFEETGVEIRTLSKIVIDLLDSLGRPLGLVTLLLGWGLGMVAIERLYKAGRRPGMAILIGFGVWMAVMIFGLVQPILILRSKL